MVSIKSKVPTLRTATAKCRIFFSNKAAYAALSTSTLTKGDALAVARIAGITAAKKTSDLIPLTHPGIGITGVNVDIELFDGHGHSSPTAIQDDANGGVSIVATVECEGKTGVEMEALTAATIASLTIYDMCKSVDKGMTLRDAYVASKTGGKSGDWIRKDETQQYHSAPSEASAAKDPIEQPAGYLDEYERLAYAPDRNFLSELVQTSIRLEKLRKAGVLRNFRNTTFLEAMELAQKIDHLAQRMRYLRMIRGRRRELRNTVLQWRVSERQREIDRGTRGKVDGGALANERARRRWNYEHGTGKP